MPRNMTVDEFGAAITGSHADAARRAAHQAAERDTKTLASMLATFADEIEKDTGRAYAPAYMREAAKRLLKRVRA